MLRHFTGPLKGRDYRRQPGEYYSVDGYWLQDGLRAAIGIEMLIQSRLMKAPRWVVGLVALVAFCAFAVSRLDEAFGNWWLIAFLAVVLPVGIWLEKRRPPTIVRSQADADKGE